MESEMSNVKITGSPMSLGAATMSMGSQRGFFSSQLVLRILGVAFTLASILFMVTSSQSVSVFGIEMTARYTYSSAFRFLVGANAVSCAFSMLSLGFVYLLSLPKSNPNNYFYLFLHDLVIMVLIVSGSAAAAAIGYVGVRGESETGWLPICDRVGKFCEKVTLSLLFSYLAFFCFLALTVMSAYKLKSK